jgi:uncharacterized membrane protein
MRKLLDVVGLAGLAALLWVTYAAVYGSSRLPDRVPTHFDASGKANGWGSPHDMIFMPLIAIAIYLLMSLASRFPSAFHYPVHATPQILPRLQAITLNLLTWLKVELAWLFAILQWVFVRAARSGDGHLFPVVIPGILFVLLATIGWHIFAIFRTACGDAIVDAPQK